jgi:hypothetical protein
VCLWIVPATFFNLLASCWFWRPYCSEAMAECLGSLAAPSGCVLSNDEVVLEQIEGLDCDSYSRLKVLPAIV